jgi:hypothetical protein
MKWQLAVNYIKSGNKLLFYKHSRTICNRLVGEKILVCLLQQILFDYAGIRL